jgi:arylsulfatase A-like enzyme
VPQWTTRGPAVGAARGPAAGLGVALRLAPVLGLAFGLALALGCSREPARPNVVLVVLDTVRRDFTGCGEGASATPNLDALMEEGTGFTNAWAPSPWTPPSHASMLTGLLPSGHRCTSKAPRFASDAVTLPEILGAAGYETVAFHSNPWLTEQMTGLLQGFESEFVSGPPGIEIINIVAMSRQGGRETVDNVSAWLGERSGDEPFFMFVNLLEAHLPFDPSPSYRRRHLSDLAPDERVSTGWANAINAGLVSADEADRELVRRLYAGDVHDADGFLGEIVTLLEEQGLFHDTVIIVTSDHGENLGDHGLMDHQLGVFETLLAVPLVVRAPGRLPPGVRHDPVVLTDIYATVLDAAGLADTPKPTYSRSLLGPPAHGDRPLVAEYAGPPATLIAFLTDLNPDLDTGRYELGYVTVRVGDLRLTVGSDGSEVLTDLAADPEGRVNLALSERAKVNLLIKLMPGIRFKDEEEDIEVDEEMREWLESLGYII